MNELVTTPTPSNPDEKLHAMLAHLLSIIFGIFPSLIFWLINKDKPQCAFVTDQAKEALNFQLNVMAVCVISFPFVFILIGVIPIMAATITSLICSILAGICVNEGKAYRYPSFIIRLIK